MSGMLFFIQLLVSVIFILCGGISALIPMAAIKCEQSLCRRLRLIPKKQSGKPVQSRKIVFERVLGCIFLVLGILLIHYMDVLLSPANSSDANLALSSGNAADRDATNFKIAVKALVATEGLLLDAPEPRPLEELPVISAKYGARDKWIDITEQVREKINNHTLTIGASNAIAGDPLYGIPKRLKVEYELDGEHKTAEVREGVILHIPPLDDPYDELKVITTPERLVALAKACPAEVGFFGKNLTTGKIVEYRPDQPACLASIVKIFVLLEVIRQADQGALDLSESINISRQNGTEACTVSAALDKMIGISDNEAANALVWCVRNTFT